MKTKPFLLATAGSTVDGRSIDDAMLEQMVSSYDPKTYGARLNIEHVRSAPDGPFRAYGDVLELSIGKSTWTSMASSRSARRCSACSM
jgi:acyl-coenzyme A thioesterase PaaI-like protein